MAKKNLQEITYELGKAVFEAENYAKEAELYKQRWGTRGYTDLFGEFVRGDDTLADEISSDALRIGKFARSLQSASPDPVKVEEAKKEISKIEERLRLWLDTVRKREGSNVPAWATLHSNKRGSDANLIDRIALSASRVGAPAIQSIEELKRRKPDSPGLAFHTWASAIRGFTAKDFKDRNSIKNVVGELQDVHLGFPALLYYFYRRAELFNKHQTSLDSHIPFFNEVNPELQRKQIVSVLQELEEDYPEFIKISSKKGKSWVRLREDKTSSDVLDTIDNNIVDSRLSEAKFEFLRDHEEFEDVIKTYPFLPPIPSYPKPKPKPKLAKPDATPMPPKSTNAKRKKTKNSTPPETITHTAADLAEFTEPNTIAPEDDFQSPAIHSILDHLSSPSVSGNLAIQQPKIADLKAHEVVPDSNGQRKIKLKSGATVIVGDAKGSNSSNEEHSIEEWRPSKANLIKLLEESHESFTKNYGDGSKTPAASVQNTVVEHSAADLSEFIEPPKPPKPPAPPASPAPDPEPDPKNNKAAKDAEKAAEKAKKDAEKAEKAKQAEQARQERLKNMREKAAAREAAAQQKAEERRAAAERRTAEKQQKEADKFLASLQKEEAREASLSKREAIETLWTSNMMTFPVGNIFAGTITPSSLMRGVITGGIIGLQSMSEDNPRNRRLFDAIRAGRDWFGKGVGDLSASTVEGFEAGTDVRSRIGGAASGFMNAAMAGGSASVIASLGAVVAGLAALTLTVKGVASLLEAWSMREARIQIEGASKRYETEVAKGNLQYNEVMRGARMGRTLQVASLYGNLNLSAVDRMSGLVEAMGQEKLADVGARMSQFVHRATEKQQKDVEQLRAFGQGMSTMADWFGVEANTRGAWGGGYKFNMNNIRDTSWMARDEKTGISYGRTRFNLYQSGSDDEITKERKRLLRGAIGFLNLPGSSNTEMTEFRMVEKGGIVMGFNANNIKSGFLSGKNGEFEVFQNEDQFKELSAKIGVILKDAIEAGAEAENRAESERLQRNAKTVSAMLSNNSPARQGVDDYYNSIFDKILNSTIQYSGGNPERMAELAQSQLDQLKRQEDYQTSFYDKVMDRLDKIQIERGASPAGISSINAIPVRVK